MAVTVNINDKKWAIPTRVTIEEWQQLQQWEVDNQAHWPWIVAAISSYDASEFDEAPQDSMQLFIGFIIAATNRRTLKHQPDYTGLTFGQFVDHPQCIRVIRSRHTMGRRSPSSDRPIH